MRFHDSQTEQKHNSVFRGLIHRPLESSSKTRKEAEVSGVQCCVIIRMRLTHIRPGVILMTLN